ncbi:MAG: TetR/AcrR family transcriptional regulator [Pseudomonadota bacterium]
MESRQNREDISKPGYHHGDLGAALVGQVRHLIERDGLSDFSISEACKALGVSTAAPYKHFSDKHDILRHVAKAGFQDLTLAMERARDSEPDDAVRRISEMGKSYVAFAARSPETFKLMFGSKPDIKDDEVTKETGHRCFDVLIVEVANHLGTENSADAALKLSIMLWSFVHGVASLKIDKDYEAVRIEADTNAMIAEATRRLLATR